MTRDMTDITPEDSVAPVYLDTRKQIPVPEFGPLDQMLADQAETEAARDRAIAKLTSLGLTEDEARALANV